MPDLEKSEYESLYKEIQDNASRVNQVIGVCVTASTALLSYVFTIDPLKLPFQELLPPFLLLSPFLIMIPSMLLIQASLHSTTRIAGYIIYRYERSGSQVGWQTAIQKYRESDEHPRRRPFRLALVSVFGGLGIASVAASVVAIFSAYKQHAAKSQALPKAFIAAYCVLDCFLLGLLALALVYSWKGWGRRPFREERERWEELCKAES